MVQSKLEAFFPEGRLKEAKVTVLLEEVGKVEVSSLTKLKLRGDTVDC